MTIWAYEELVHGVNWFRRLLGLAYVILLAIQPVLFVFGDMTIVAGSHPSLFFTYTMIPAVKVMRFVPAHVTIFYFIMYPPILFVQAVIHF